MPRIFLKEKNSNEDNDVPTMNELIGQNRERGFSQKQQPNMKHISTGFEGEGYKEGSSSQVVVQNIDQDFLPSMEDLIEEAKHKDATKQRRSKRTQSGYDHSSMMLQQNNRVSNRCSARRKSSLVPNVNELIN